MLNIKETKEVVVLAIQLTAGAKKALENKKVGLEDLPILIGLFPLINNAIKGIELVPAELKDLSESEWEEIFAEVTPAIGELAGEEIKKIAETALEILKQILVAVGILKKSFESVKTM